MYFYLSISRDLAKRVEELTGTLNELAPTRFHSEKNVTTIRKCRFGNLKILHSGFFFFGKKRANFAQIQGKKYGKKYYMDSEKLIGNFVK